MSVHTIAIIKGAVEGDPLQHLGSLLGVDIHAALAVHLGLIEPAAGEAPFTATDAGREFYADANLAALPDGRANHWGTAADHARDLLRQMDAAATLRRRLITVLAGVSHVELAETVIESLGVPTARRLIAELT